MEWLNYHHLLYFWHVAQEGSLTRACEKLRLSPSTVSGQIRRLEEAIGRKLFSKSGRNLVMSEDGLIVFRYAEEIFSLGRELMDTLNDRPVGKPLRITIGVADVVPKLVAWRLIQSALKLSEPVQLICRENKPDQLLTELSQHHVDVILTDAPANPQVKVKVFNHQLGKCGIVFLAVKALSGKYSQGFPGSLDGAPLLLPTENTSLRRSLDQYFEGLGVHPRIIGEFEDSALLNAFGQEGLGIFPVPEIILAEVKRQHNVYMVGCAPEVYEYFYAITVERRIKHPAAIAICESARLMLSESSKME
ncbi:MAG: transcriptional activator NhaR [Proteobacteria bacterium]|nr:transcriptional activator NhaR [Pseudomonadota bacterium]